MTNKHLLKNIAIICFILITLSNIIAFLHPAKGYELSIYESTPTLVWIFLILSITGGVTIIIHQVYTKEYKNSNFWLFGALILILSRMSLLFLPFIRGYYTWRGDNISNIGLVKDIFFSGHITNDNFYPITHILLTEICSISGLSEVTIANYSTSLFSVLYVVFIYLLTTTVLHERGEQLLVFALIGGVFFNDYDVFLRPNGWSFLMLPLVLFLYFKHSIKYRIPFVIFLILYPFFHPFSSITLVASFIVIGLSQTTLGYIIYDNKHEKRELFPIVPIFIVLCILLPWILSFQGFELNIRQLFEALTTGHSPDVIASMGSTLDKIHVHGFEFIKLFIKLYGDDFIFIVFSLIAGILIVKRILSNRFKNPDNIKNLVSLLIIFLITGFLYFAYLFSIIPGLEAIGGARFQRFLVLLTPVLTGFAIYEISKKVHSTRLISVGIVCIIVLASAISIGSLYRSPYVLRPCGSATQMDMSGMNWYINYKNPSIGSITIISPPYRFADGILGTNETSQRSDLEYAPTIPDHFDYTNHSTLGEYYTKDKYAAITQLDRVVYVTVWKAVGRFNESDFCRLNEDPTVDKLYENGETEVLYIHSKMVKP